MKKSGFGQTEGSDTIFIVLFVFFLLLLITIPTGGYCYTNREAIKVYIQDMSKDTEAFTMTTKGAKHYKNVKSTEKLSDVIKGDSCIFVLADWCNHCKSLKSSGMLQDLASDIPVFVMDDKHPEAQMVMKELQSQGFPTLGMVKDGKMTKYDGAREASAMRQAFMQ
jgi:thiol:disulfide interchange protein